MLHARSKEITPITGLRVKLRRVLHGLTRKNRCIPELNFIILDVLTKNGPCKPYVLCYEGWMQLKHVRVRLDELSSNGLVNIGEDGKASITRKGWVTHGKFKELFNMIGARLD